MTEEKQEIKAAIELTNKIISLLKKYPTLTGVSALINTFSSLMLSEIKEDYRKTALTEIFDTIQKIIEHRERKEKNNLLSQSD